MQHLEVINHGQINNSAGSDKINIRHLKHPGLLVLAYFSHNCPHPLKLAIITILKPNKNNNPDTSYRLIHRCCTCTTSIHNQVKQPHFQVRQIYLYTLHTWSCSRLNLQISKTLLDMYTHSKILSLTLYPRLKYKKHIHHPKHPKLCPCSKSSL